MNSFILEHWNSKFETSLSKITDQSSSLIESCYYDIKSSCIQLFFHKEQNSMILPFELKIYKQKLSKLSLLKQVNEKFLQFIQS